MVVKSKIGRKRYIIIKIDSSSEITKRDLIYTLNRLTLKKINDHNILSQDYDSNTYKKSGKSTKNFEVMEPLAVKFEDSRIDFHRKPWVIFIRNNYGLIRCHHLDTKKTINLLQSIQTTGKTPNKVKISTLGTTGTIRSARKKYLDKLILYPLSNSYSKRV